MKKLSLILMSVFALQGCIETAIIAGAVTAVSSANDPRSVGTQIDDTTIEVRADFLLMQEDGISKHTNLSVISYNGTVLIVGQSPNQFLIDKALKIVKDINGVKKIHNQIKLGTPASLSTKTQDAWITAKVKSDLLTDEQIKGHNVKVVTENGIVYLMGLVDSQEANSAATLAANINGVERVIKVFD